MASMLICFKSNIDPRPFKGFVCGDPIWKKGVEQVFILNEDETKALISVVGTEAQCLSVPGRGSIKKVCLREILYLEKVGRCIFIHQENGPTCGFYGKFEEVMESLSGVFFRCHKSYIVNLEKAEELRRYTFLLKNGETLPVSQKKYQEARECFRMFLSFRIFIEKDRRFIEK